MRIRSKILLTLGLACLSTGVLAGGAVAHGGGKHGGKNLKVEVRGLVSAITQATDTTDGSVTVDPNTPPATAAGVTPVTPPTSTLATWTCVIPAGNDLSSIMVGDQVKAKCADKDGALVLKRIRERHADQGNHEGEHHSLSNGGSKGGKVEVEARGTVTAFTSDPVTGEGSISVLPGGTGSTLPSVDCVLKSRTRIIGLIAVGDTVKIKCKSNSDGQLVAKKIKEKGAVKPGEVKVEVKGPIDAVSDTSITIAGVTCTVGDPALVAGLAVTQFVEAHCSGTPFALDKVELES